MDYLVLTKVHGAILGPISQILGWILNVLVTFTNSFGVLNNYFIYPGCEITDVPYDDQAAEGVQADGCHAA